MEPAGECQAIPFAYFGRTRARIGSGETAEGATSGDKGFSTVKFKRLFSKFYFTNNNAMVKAGAFTEGGMAGKREADAEDL